MRRILATLAFLLIAGAGGRPSLAQEIPSGGTRGWSGSTGHHDARSIVSAQWGIPGDTLRVWHVFRNVADSSIVVNVLPCGGRFEGDLELVHLPDDVTCLPEERTLQPGDSVASLIRAVIVGEPGSYTLTVSHAAPARSGPGTRSFGFSFEVMTPEDMSDLPGGGRTAPGGPNLSPLDYVLEFRSDAVDSPVSRRDIEALFQRVMIEEGFQAMPVSRVAARRLLPRAYLLAEIHEEEDGGYRSRMRWVWNEATDAAEPEVPQYRRYCIETSSAGRTGPVSLGASLAIDIQEVLEGHRDGRCGPRTDLPP